MTLQGLDVVTLPGGSRLRARVRPGARRSAIEGVIAGALRISVTAAPEKGKANAAVERLLAAGLVLPRSRVSVVAGAASRDKVIEIRGIGPSEVMRRLGALPPD